MKNLSSGHSIHGPIEKNSKNHAREKSHRASQHKPARWYHYLALIFLTIFCYSPIVHSGLLWTEYDQVERSPFQLLEKWTEIWTSSEGLREDPITQSTYMLEQAIPLPAPMVHHSINLFLHIVSIILLLKVLDTLKLPVAFCASLVFALHPATLQTIFWSGFRTELVGLILLLTALNIGLTNKGFGNYARLIVVWLIAYWLHPANLFLPMILGLCIFYQKTTFELKDYNRLLPLIFFALFVGVFVHNKQTAIHYDLGEQINFCANNLFFYLNQAIVPIRLALFHPIEESQNLRFGTIINLLPFLFIAVCYLMIIPKCKKFWARGLLLGLTSYMLLSIYSLGSFGTFIDGTPSQVNHKQYIALPAILTTVVCMLGAITRKMGISTSLLWYSGFSVFIVIQFSYTTVYAKSLSNREQMWSDMSELWPSAWLPKLALLHTIQESEEKNLSTQNRSIDLLEDILHQQPNLTSERKLLARIYRKAGQNTNALRHYKYILSKEEPDNTFILEAASFYDQLSLKWEAEKARQRIKNHNDL